MAGNKNLNSAARAKKDEFYTQIRDIENEMYHYRHHFKDKVVLCNCDDPYESDFFKYFTIYFNTLGLSYAGSPIVQTELDFWGTANENPTFDKRTQAIRLDVTEVRDFNGDGATDLADVKWLLENNRNAVTYLEDDGDFRSAECVAALREADIVVTNPPFSLFREYVAQLMKFDKKFLIIGNINCITYKEIFPLIMQNKVWLGYRMGRGISGFMVPETYELYGTEARIDDKGRRIVSTNQCLWLTNLDVNKRHENILLFRRYAEEPELFPHYDNYDAIEVSKTMNIPCDYDGVMGVPITFLDKYNPAQFEILGHTSSNDLSPAVEALRTDPKHRNRGRINGKEKYDRILIRRRQQ